MTSVKKNNYSIVDTIFFIIIFIIFIFGSVKMYEGYTLPFSIIFSLSYIGLRLIQKRGIKLSKHVLYFILLTAVTFIHYKLFGGKIYFSLIWLTGGLYWLIFYNISKKITKIFIPSLVFFALTLSTIYLILVFSGITVIESNNIIMPLYKGMMHNRLGDLWAVVLTGVLFDLTQKRKAWHIPILILGITFVAISFSRSAIISLIVGAFFIFYKLRDNNSKYKKIFMSLLVISSLLFILFGVFKTTLFSRPYTFQAIASIANEPFGIGLGNFSKISSQTSLAHNIILEMMSGVGIFSIVFIAWLVNIIRKAFRPDTSLLFGSMFLAIMTNFFFDITYDIPTMMWLWIITGALMFKANTEK